MRFRKLLPLTLIIAFATITTGIVSAQSGGGFDLPWWLVSNGGLESQDSNFSLEGSVGQPFADQTAGGGFRITSGFWNRRVTDTLLPTVLSITLADPNPTDAASVDFTLTFSEDVIEVDISDFTLTKSGTVSGEFVSELNGSNSTYTVRVNTGAGNGMLRLDIPDTASITDLAGNPLDGLPYTGAETYLIVKTAPVLLSPANGSTLLNNRSTFDWSDFPAAIGYNIQISRNNTFTLLVSNTNLTGGTNSTYTPAVNLLAKTNMWWRVRAKLTATTYTPWSEVRTFTTANPPPAPLLVAPVANALITSPTIKLDWGNVTMPAGTTFQKYEVQMATNSTFTTGTTFTDAAISETIPPTLTPNTLYYWRVRAYNTLGQYGVWSASRSFRAALLTPSLLSPGMDVPNPAPNVHTRRPTFTWAVVPGATSYTIEVSTSSTFATKAINTTATTNSYTHTADLAANTTYFWRVKSNGTNGPSLYSSPLKTFLTGNPPSVPTLTSPLNNALVTTTTPLLDWNNSTVPAGAPAFYQYEVQFATNRTFSAGVQNLNVSGISNSQTLTPVLLNGTTYYWRVRSVNVGADGDGNLADDNDSSGWSLSRSFRVPYAAPALLLPANSATGVALKPTFTWNPILGTTSYTIQVSKNDTFTLLVVNKTIYAPITTYIHTLNLLPNTPYYWRVRANGTYGPGLWQFPIFSFTTTP